MGDDRSEHQDKPATQVFTRVSEYFNVNKNELYRLWLAYNNRKVINKNPRMTILQLESHEDMYAPEALNYFMAMGFELFNKEYLKEIRDGK